MKKPQSNIRVYLKILVNLTGVLELRHDKNTKELPLNPFSEIKGLILNNYLCKSIKNSSCMYIFKVPIIVPNHTTNSQFSTFNFILNIYNC